MSHEPKDHRKVLIEELDQLRYTLHEGPEVQQNIPMLDEAFGELDDPFELEIPILTDPIDDKQDTGLETSNLTNIPKIPLPIPARPVGQPEITSTPASVKLEDLLDELIAEYLPTLEHQLREKLRLALGSNSMKGDENHIDAS